MLRFTSVQVVVWPLLCVSLSAAYVSLPVDSLQLGRVNDVSVGLTHLREDADGGRAVRVDFGKADHVRRMVPLELRADVVPHLTDCRSLAVRYRLKLQAGEAPRLGVVAVEQDGECWLRTGDELGTGEGTEETRISLSRMRQADFSTVADGRLDWSAIETLWIGIVLDGAVKGSLTLRELRLSEEPHEATEPLRLMAHEAGRWQLHHDPAVDAGLRTDGRGSGGQPAMKVEFRFPGGRHMYCTCSLQLAAEEPEGYQSLRITYRAALPAGIAGILVILSEESGACYHIDPLPGPSVDWVTVTVPISDLKEVAWGRDPNKRLDRDRITTLWVGTHGTASGAGGAGTIEVYGAELVP